MTSEQWHKDRVVAYIIIGIVVVALIALYIYMQLAGMSAQQQAAPTQVGPLGGPTVLSSSQSSAKAAAIEAVTVQKPVSLTKKQSATKAAVIKAFEMENTAK